MLKVDSINQFYGGSHILRDVSFDVASGQVTTLLGRNGVGKTTLLRCLMGLLPLRSGRVVWNGMTLDALPPSERVARGFAYVPQGREIFPRLTVEENLLVGGAARARTGIPAYIFDLFPILKDMRRRRGGDLSGGQQQQLAIGRALMNDPRLLILDEPTEGIQPSIIEEIGRIIRKLATGATLDGKGMAILLVEQYYDFAKRIGDRFLVMSRGEIVARGAAAEMDARNVKSLLAI